MDESQAGNGMPVHPGGISFAGGCTHEGKPFVHIFVDGKPYGQLSPREILALGIRAIQSGQEAERDAALVKAIIAMSDDLPTDEAKQEAAASMLITIRRFREQAVPEPATMIEVVDLAERADQQARSMIEDHRRG